MLFLLSPAKTLDYDTPVPKPLLKKATDPAYTAQAAQHLDQARGLCGEQRFGGAAAQRRGHRGVVVQGLGG